MDGLEKLQKSLYARESEDGKEGGEAAPHEPFFHAEGAPPRVSWSGEPASPEAHPPEPRSLFPMVKKIFIASALFFVAASAFALFVFLRGGNVVSSEKVAVQFAGPLSAAGGEPLSFEVSVRNDNNAPIEAADLLLEFPEGTRRTDDPRAALLRYREALGAIAPGENILKKEEAVFFGEEGAHLAVTATLEYRVQGSNALLKKTARYEVVLQSAPLSLAVDAPREAANGSEVQTTVTITSNSATLLHDLVVSAEYPFGFSFAAATPPPAAGERVWTLGDLAAGASRRIVLRGTFAGSDGDERIIKWSAGPAETAGGKKLGIALVSLSQSILLRKPFLALTLSVAGDTGSEHLTEKGKTIPVVVSWANNLPSPATDAQIVVALKGALYDPASVLPEGGYYRASDGTLVWDTSSNSALALLAPGAQGEASFSVTVRGPATGAYALTNPSFSIDATISARGPAGAGESGGAIQTTAHATVKLLADLSLSTRVARVGGPFANRGPVPPKVGAETTYTLVWSLANAFNDLASTRVSATLPSYVKFLDAVSPSSESVSYDPVSGTVSWNAGDLKARVGIGGAPREVAFQIAFTPADNQAGTVPNLIGTASAEGDDRFTGRHITSTTRPALTTKFGDASFLFGQEVVGK